MHRSDTEAGNAQVLHLWEEPKIVNQVQAKWRKRARRYVLGGTYIKWERLYFTLLFFTSPWTISNKFDLQVI